MQRRCRLFASVAAILLSSCQAKTIPLASTVTASGTLSDIFSQSNDGAQGANISTKSKGKGVKSPLRVPKLWGRQSKSDEKKSESVAGDDEAGNSDDGKSNKVSESKETEEGTKDDDTSPSTSDAGDTTESLKQEETSEKQSADGNDKTETTEQHHSEPQSTNNQTRSGVLYMNIAPPNSPMSPHHHARPVPYPYMPQQQSSPSQNKSPSLLSSLLSVLLPRPQHMPPSPYGPPMHPSSPSGPSPIISLVLRLALISLGTFIFDFLGVGSHSDAYLPTPAQHYTFERVNDRYRRDGSALRQALESPPPGVRKQRWKRVFGKRRREAVSTLILSEESQVVEPPSLGNGALYNRTVIIVDMKPDSRVGNGMAEHLRDTVSFLIEQHRDQVDKRNLANHHAFPSKFRLPFLPRRFSAASPSRSGRTHKGMRPAIGNELEIVLFLDSGGGTVQDYGLASSQLSRLRDEPHITLSVCVDRVAASGGYMMACQATPGHLFAAPFAMLGSIGVLMETINVNEVLQKYGVKPLVIKAGKNKAPLKTLGEVTSEELQMAQDDADVIHGAFQKWVTKSRPNVVASEEWIDKVCTGAVFLGKEAQELGLVDKVLTSDEYVAERIAAGDRVLRLLPYRGPQMFGLKISPLDLLLSGMDAEGRAKIRGRIQGLGMRMFRCAAPLFRVGATVGVLNHLASLQNNHPVYSWAA